VAYLRGNSQERMVTAYQLNSPPLPLEVVPQFVVRTWTNWYEQLLVLGAFRLAKFYGQELYSPEKAGSKQEKAADSRAVKKLATDPVKSLVATDGDAVLGHAVHETN
jgi:hypothetical protein